jgi:carbon storage regulator
VRLRASRTHYTSTKEGRSNMLVLSRQAGERLFIGDDIVITVVRIGPNSVRLGIGAPVHMDIAREELCGASAIESTGKNATK